MMHVTLQLVIKKICEVVDAYIIFGGGLVSPGVSSILVYLFLQHVVHICSTWMTSCVQLEKNEG